MRKTLFAFAALAGVMMLDTGAAQARDYRFCLNQGWEAGPGDCAYNTYAQCMASASGRVATCNVNPRVAFGQQRQQPRRPRGEYKRF